MMRLPKPVDRTSTAPVNGGVAPIRTVVLVEGESDRAALETLARRVRRDLAATGVAVVPMGGITNIRVFATRYGPRGRGLTLTGLYDAPEEHVVCRGLAAAGLDAAADPDSLAALGFFKCTADLEDELIRAVGLDGVEQVIAEAGEARSLRLLSQMPAQREWTRLEVVRRFLGSKSGRKARYAVLLSAAVDADRVPDPLAALIAAV
jgi:hypothetical protein